MSNYIAIESNPSLTTLSDYWTLNNSNLMYNLGNIGIGVPYPRAALHVDGNMSIGYNNSPQPDNLIIAGNVGIGTNNPQDKLHIFGDNMMVSGTVNIGTFQLSSNIIQNTNGGLQLPGITISNNGNVGIGTNNPQTTLDVSGTCFARGHVIQTVTVQDTTHSTYSLPANNVTVTLTTLNLVITPKKANSTIVLQWMVNGEVTEQSLFVVQKDGTPIGLNTDAGNVNWSGTASAAWDNNTASTPSNYNISYTDTPNTTSPVTYSLGVKRSMAGSTAYTFFLNRTSDAPLQDFRESLISCGVAWEVCN